jgi:hypothetical protein
VYFFLRDLKVENLLLSQNKDVKIIGEFHKVIARIVLSLQQGTQASRPVDGTLIPFLLMRVPFSKHSEILQDKQPS